MPKQVVVSSPLEERYEENGNYIFKDKEGKEHKIGIKRDNFGELVKIVQANPGKALSLKFTKWTTPDNKEVYFISGVVLVADQLPKPEEAPKTQTEVTKPAPRESKNRAFAMSYAKDLAVAGKIGVEDMKRLAEDMCLWMDGLT